MSRAVSPSYAEIMERSQALAARRPSCVGFREIGPSEEGRAIPLLLLGDGDRDLPLLQVVGGTHGSEETGRAAAMAFAEWLAGEGAENVEHLSAVVIPCANPDGAEANSYHNARDVNLYHAYPYNARALTAEARAIEDIALEVLPDSCIDVHGLAGGAMGDSAFLIPTLGANMGMNISVLLCDEINAAALALGYPQRHPWVEAESKREAGSICDKMATLTNAFCLTMEITENYYPLEDSVRSGLVRLKKLVEIGRRTQSNQPYPGFPCDTLLGGPMEAVMPFGSTYRRRRENRIRTMAGLLERRFYFERSHADPGGVGTLTLRLDDPPADPPQGLVFQMALDPRVTVKRVRYVWPDGEEACLKEAGLAEEDGYYIWQQDGIPMVRASIPRRPAQGEHRVMVEYDAPFRPHVQPTWSTYSHER